jgi:preprotein translocase subunit Sec63
MSTGTALEQIVLELSRLIVPLSMDIGAPAAAVTAGNIKAAIKPFILLVVLNFLTFALLYYLGKIVLGTLEIVLGRLIYGITLGSGFFRKYIMRNLRRRLLSRRAQKRSPPRTRIIEDDASFASWEEISKGTLYWRMGGELTHDVRQALNILGVHAFSTESDVRKAYLNLMKKHHPDHYMRASPMEIERAQRATVQIRAAYDKITGQFCELQ